MPLNFMVFLIRRELRLLTILWSQLFESIKWLTVLVHVVYKENHTISRHICVDHYILLSKPYKFHFKKWF